MKIQIVSVQDSLQNAQRVNSETGERQNIQVRQRQIRALLVEGDSRIELNLSGTPVEQLPADLEVGKSYEVSFSEATSGK